MNDTMIASSAIAAPVDESLDMRDRVFPQSHEAWGEAAAVPEGICARQYAAIHLCVPDSGVPWIDKMIRQSLRYKIASNVMPGLMGAADLTLVDRPGRFVTKAAEYAKVCVPDPEE